MQQLAYSLSTSDRTANYYSNCIVHKSQEKKDYCNLRLSQAKNVQTKS